MQFSCHLLRLLLCEFAPGWHRHDHICRAATCCDFFDGARLDTQQYMNVFCAPSCLSLLTTSLLTLQVRTSLSLCIPDSNSASLVSEHYAHSSRYTCSTSSPALPARSPASLISTIDTSRHRPDQFRTRMRIRVMAQLGDCQAQAWQQCQ